MFMQNWARLANINVAGLTNQRAYTRLRNGMRSLGVMLRITVQVDVSVANATALRNRGSVLALIDQVGISENGQDRVLLNGRMAGYVGRVNSVVETPSAVRLTTPNIQAATILDEYLFIPFGSSWQINPTETAFVEQDPRLDLSVFVVWNPDTARLFTIGGATVVIGAPTITAWQIFDDERQVKRPLFRPFYREQSMVVSAAGLQEPLYLKTTRFIRALVIQQDTNVGEVSDIVSNVILRGDSRDFIAPPGGTIADLARLYENWQLARALNDPGYLYINFASAGRLSNILSPVNDANPRFELTAAPSGAAGATSSIVRVGILELERLSGLTQDQLAFVA